MTHNADQEVEQAREIAHELLRFFRDEHGVTLGQAYASLSLFCAACLKHEQDSKRRIKTAMCIAGGFTDGVLTDDEFEEFIAQLRRARFNIN